MIVEGLQEIGLSKNEAEIYRALVRETELSVAEISVKAKVHRRNVYDAIERLVDKGLVFEILERRETRYQAVEPEKLRELIQEKENTLSSILPKLEHLFKQNPSEQSVYIYRGIEGWKNYMRDILRVSEDFYCIAGKGAWMDERLKHFFPQFVKEARRKKIRYKHLFDYEVKEEKHPILEYVGKDYKFFPKGYSAPASVDFFGDRVYLCSTLEVGGVAEDAVFTVIVNQQVADSFRTWFTFMWDFCPSPKRKA